jgi:transposase
MKNTHVSRSNGGHARYDAEYKREALKLWRSSGRSAAAVAAELGIRAPLLYRWARAEREPGGPKSTSGPAAAQPSVAALQAEVERLRTENAKLLEQREVLKKSLGILSEPPPRGMPGSPR